MKKLIVAIIAGFMLSFAGTAAHAAYEPTTDTDVKAKSKGDVKPGKKARFIIKPRVQGDTGQCTGSIVVIYKASKEVVRLREKAVASRVPFNGRVPKKTTKIIVIYERGPKDPCDKSRTGFKV